MEQIVQTFITLCKQAKENKVDPAIIGQSKRNLEKLFKHDNKNVVRIIDDVLPDNVFVNLLDGAEFETFETAKDFVCKLFRRRNETIFLIKLKDGSDPLDLIAYGNGSVFENIFNNAHKRRVPDTCLDLDVLKKDKEYYLKYVNKKSPYFCSNVNIFKLTTNLDKIKEDVKRGCIPVWRDKEMQTPLHVASGVDKFLPTVNYLIQQKVPLNDLGKNRKTALELALEKAKSLSNAKSLLLGGADPRFPHDVIEKIIRKGCVWPEVFVGVDIQQYVSSFNLVDKLDEYFALGGVPTKELLEKAVKKGEMEKIDLYISKGAEPYEGILFDAVLVPDISKYKLEDRVTKILTKFKSIDGNEIDPFTGNNILFEFSKHPSCARNIYNILKERNFDITHKNLAGNTILHSMVATGGNAIVFADILLKKPELREVKNKNGITPANMDYGEEDTCRKKIFKLTDDQLQMILDGTSIKDIGPSCRCA